MIDVSALSSISASLNDLVRRLAEVAGEADENDETAIEVLEVERTLRTSTRRLNKVLRDATR